MPSANTATRSRLPPVKVLTKPRKRPLRRLHELEQRLRIDARRRDVAPDPVDRQQPEREQHPLAQVRDREDVAEALDHACSSSQRAARRLDLGAGRLAELVRRHRERLADLAVAQHLDRLAACAPGRARPATSG